MSESTRTRTSLPLIAQVVHTAAPRLMPAKSCCETTTQVSAGPGTAVVALVGAPNTGKSTLFNALTGSRVTTGNWPGTTVEVSRGVWRATLPPTPCACGTCPEGHAESTVSMTLLDLPGAYSLDAHSPDEQLTRALLQDGPAEERPDLCVVTVDASRLAHGLYLVAQVRELALRVVLAVTMSDIALQRGVCIDSHVLADRLGCPVVMVDPRRRTGLDTLAAVVRTTLVQPVPPPRPTPDAPDSLTRDDDRFTWLSAAVEQATVVPGNDRLTLSDTVDRWVTAPVVGPLVFLTVMWAVFQLTTTVAAPLQDALDRLFSGPVTHGMVAMLTVAHLDRTWVEGLLVNGLVAGVGMLLTFVPLMALMFVLLALLEDSGYLARAAVVTDRLMRTIGLPGRAFLPLIVGFGCNVPAISATRILPDARQRLLTVLLVPFTSCSARLTVFVMLGTVFFGRHAGTAVFGMYVMSVALIVLVGLLMRRTLWRTMGSEPLIIDLPAYHVPTLRLTAAVVWQRLRGFLRTASGIIVVTVSAVWLLQSVPAVAGESFGQVPVQDSVYGVVARTISPVFAPAGFGQWQTASALMVGFVAKEAVISSWAQTYATDQPQPGQAGLLGDHIQAAFQQSSAGHTLPAVLAFMVFLLAYTPCVATLAAQRREVGLRWTAFGVGVQLTTAWLLAVAVFQVGRLFW
ncbi:MAG TPA: ferrous iron transport protein B [Propionibacteriaceae bacterium]|nr:ferrous iron transport protein B [Propionibacteriaceae bacterium]